MAFLFLCVKLASKMDYHSLLFLELNSEPPFLDFGRCDSLGPRAHFFERKKKKKEGFALGFISVFTFLLQLLL